MKNTNTMSSVHSWSTSFLGFILSTSNSLYMGCLGIQVFPLIQQRKAVTKVLTHAEEPAAEQQQINQDMLVKDLFGNQVRILRADFDYPIRVVRNHVELRRGFHLMAYYHHLIQLALERAKELSLARLIAKLDKDNNDLSQPAVRNKLIADFNTEKKTLIRILSLSSRINTILRRKYDNNRPGRKPVKSLPLRKIHSLLVRLYARTSFDWRALGSTFLWSRKNAEHNNSSHPEYPVPLD